MRSIFAIAFILTSQTALGQSATLQGAGVGEALPTVVSATVPFYPGVVQVAHIQGVVRLRVSTDGSGVISVETLSGQPMLAKAAEENVRAWHFERHEPTTFETTFRYSLLPVKCDAKCNCESDRKPSVLLQLPTVVEVNAKEVRLCDPTSKRPRL